MLVTDNDASPLWCGHEASWIPVSASLREITPDGPSTAMIASGSTGVPVRQHWVRRFATDRSRSCDQWKGCEGIRLEFRNLIRSPSALRVGRRPGCAGAVGAHDVAHIAAAPAAHAAPAP